ncbi:MAG: ATP-binding protein [archaeon]
MIIKNSLKLDILFFLLIIITLSLGFIAYFSVYSIITAEESAKQSAKYVLQEQAREFIVQLSLSSAEKNDMLFENARKDASNVAAFATNIFDNPEAFAREAYWKFDDNIIKGENGQLMNRMDDLSSVFIPNHVAVDDELKKRVELIAYLNFIFPKILEKNPNEVAIWMVGLGNKSDQSYSIYYPNIGLGNISPPDEKTLETIFVAIANPENNPERKVVWTPVYDDPAGQGLMVSAVAPIYTKEGFSGVIGVDITLNTIIKNIEKYAPVEQSYSFLVDKEGYSIALPEQAWKEILGRDREQEESRVDLNNLTNNFASVLHKMKNGITDFNSIKIDNKQIYVANAPLKETGFSFGLVVEEKVLLKAVKSMETEIDKSTQDLIYFRILPIGLLILIATCIISFVFISHLTRPIKVLTETTKEISKGNYDIKLNIASNNEIGQLATSFNQMTQDLKKSKDELEDYSKTLEKKVHDRTQELEQKDKQLITFNRELEEANQKLKILDYQKDEFISVAAHELKTPLTSIRGFAQLMKNGKVLKDTEKSKHYLSLIDENTQRLYNLIIDLVDSSRLNLGKLKLNIEDVDVNKLFNDAKENMSIVIKEKGLTGEFSIEKSLPKIKADSERIMQVIRNLISNSIKFTEKGTISLKVYKKGKLVQFEVKDTGYGIPDKNKKLIFSRFYQVDSSMTRKAGGSGLGLSICKGLVENMGGKIWFTSEEGKGSTFFFTMPIAK